MMMTTTINAGMAVVEYHPVYHWEKSFKKCNKEIDIRVFDTQEDRELKKVDYHMADADHRGGKSGSMYACFIL